MSLAPPVGLAPPSRPRHRARPDSSAGRRRTPPSRRRTSERPTARRPRCSSSPACGPRGPAPRGRGALRSTPDPGRAAPRNPTRAAPGEPPRARDRRARSSRSPRARRRTRLGTRTRYPRVSREAEAAGKAPRRPTRPGRLPGGRAIGLRLLPCRTVGGASSRRTSGGRCARQTVR